jgi:hypothetical protein
MAVYDAASTIRESRARYFERSAPRRTFRAFGHGWRSRNLYRGQFSDTLLDRTVGELREELGIHSR